MSSIDQYKHRHLGFIECLSTNDFVWNNPIRKIALYELQQDIPNSEKDFDGKVGDIILGGGSGEAPAFRISIPEAITFFTTHANKDLENLEKLYKAFWTPTQSYIFYEGFTKAGWRPNIDIECWLADNLCLLLVTNIEHFSKYRIKNIVSSDLKFFPTNP